MAHLLISLLFPLMMASMPFDSTGFNQDPVFDKENCTFKEIPLYGRVQVVDEFADFTVEIVDVYPDLNVKKVDTTPIQCGEWVFVDSFPDFTIRFVDGFPDFTIRFVDIWPGTN